MAGQVATPIRRRPDLMVRALATVGVAFIVFQAWGFLAWLFDGGATPFETDAAIPDSSRSAVHLGQVLMPLVALAWWAYVARGVARERALTWPLAITVVWGLVYWQESLANLTGPRFAYNAHFVDRGDWTAYLPFITDAGPVLPQPLVMEPAVFVGLLPLVSWLAYHAMRKLHDRTGWSRGLVALVVYTGVLAFELGAELRSIAQGAHAYPEVYGALSIRDGSPDQFPLYENWLLSLMWFLPGLALFLMRDGLRPSLRLLLIGVGALNIAFLLYNLIAFVWLPADTSAPMPPWLNPRG